MHADFQATIRIAASLCAGIDRVGDRFGCGRSGLFLHYCQSAANPPQIEPAIRMSSGIVEATARTLGDPNGKVLIQILLMLT